MNASTEKRACERRRHTASIEFSYFNKTTCHEGQTLNHCDEGLCFRSEVFLQPGAAVFVRAKSFHPNGACTGNCRGLRLVTLAKVKWCKEFFHETEPSYEIGAKYYHPGF
jgi:hypothetical protein